MASKDTTTAETISLTDLLSCIANASTGFRHAEALVQQRFYNFLMAESILLLAASAILAANNFAIPNKIFLFTVALLGLVLSIAWTILDYRQRFFIDLHMEIIESLEQEIKNPSHRVSEPIANLRDGKKVTFPVSKKEVMLSNLPRFMRSSNLIIGAPIAFGAVYFILICVAFFI
jgi:hypothetical protein